MLQQESSELYRYTSTFAALSAFVFSAPEAVPLCSRVAATVSVTGLADRSPRALADGEQLSLGRHAVQWFDTPHVPHGWDCGVLFDGSTGTLLCGDLFTQPGAEMPPVTETEVLSASEAMRGMMDYYAHATKTAAILEGLAALKPSTLACQHGSAYRGDGAALLRELTARVERG